MKSYEMVEKLSEKTGITLEKAKEVLERANWDILDAMIILEKEHQSPTAGSAPYAQPQPQVNPNVYSEVNPVPFVQTPVSNLPILAKDIPNAGSSNCGAGYTTQPTPSASENFGRFCGKLKKLLKKSMSNSFVVSQGDKEVASIPVLVFVILLIVCFWTVVPAMIIGLFFNLKYSFSGPIFPQETINDVMNKASEVTTKIKTDFCNGMNDADK